MNSSYKVVHTKDVNKCFRTLAKAGKKGKDCITRARAAMSEASTEGEIASLTRTSKGESRLPDIEKYNLGDGYRLVVQLIDGKKKTRAFLFCGDHEDTEAWLDAHRGYRWVKSGKDKVLSFTKASVEDDERSSVAYPNIEVHTTVLNTPLVSSAETSRLCEIVSDSTALDYVMAITFSQWEENPSDIIERLETMTTTSVACFLDDYLSMLHKNEYDQAFRRIELELGEAKVVAAEELAAAVASVESAEIFVTWDDSRILSDEISWADWLLYLHPEQKKIAEKDFNGPARLRGVSGSGKTCVMLHRARYLARKHSHPVLLLALTESVRKLLDKLARELCGTEYAYITTSTMNSHCAQIFDACHPKRLAEFTRSDMPVESAILDAVAAVKSQPDFAKVRLSNLSQPDLHRFVREELYYVRTRLKPSEYRTYLDTKNFARRGRGEALGATGREVIYSGLIAYTSYLASRQLLDYEGIAAAALALLQKDTSSLEVLGIWQAGWDEGDIKSALQYRAVLADEVQDLSEIEVSVLAYTPNLEQACAESSDGLFLVGDGVQKVYSKGFSLKQCGISVANRSYTLKKNYRNTYEIATAAYALVSGYEFLDADEEDVRRPTEPDYPTRRGMKPQLVKCRNMQDELEFVVQTITSGIKEEEFGVSYCIIGLNSSMREQVAKALDMAKLHWAELKSSSYELEDAKIYISTIESAKGYEFHKVFVLGLEDGEIPRRGNDPESVKQDVSRLYVAMTRAIDELYLCYIMNSYRSPSSFLGKVSNHCAEYRYIDSNLLPMI